MGTCCFGNKPSEKFIGTWTDNKYIELNINENGNITYQKQTEHTNVNYNGPTRFKDNGFFFCCCCCCLRGTYVEGDDYEPQLNTNGVILKRM